MAIIVALALPLPCAPLLSPKYSSLHPRLVRACVMGVRLHRMRGKRNAQPGANSECCCRCITILGVVAGRFPDGALMIPTLFSSAM
jgi:hypothetical protein